VAAPHRPDIDAAAEKLFAGHESGGGFGLARDSQFIGDEVTGSSWNNEEGNVGADQASRYIFDRAVSAEEHR